MSNPAASDSGHLIPRPLRHELSRVVLRGERTRAVLLSIAAGVVTLSVIVLNVLFPGLAQHVFGWQIRRHILVGIIAAAGLSELLLWYLLGVLERRGTAPPNVARYVGAFFEVSLPTFIAVYVCNLGHPLFALLGPPIVIYVMLIMLSTLRLDFRICVFTGVVAAAQYAFLSYHTVSIIKAEHIPADPLLIMPLHHIGKTCSLLAAGLLAGVVTRQILGHVGTALQTVQERDRVVDLFGRHVSPAVVDKLLAQPNLEGEVRRVCVMFFDIRNFTTFSEGRAPEEVVRFLNQLFAPLIDCVNRHHGIINKFLGDGFMAVFGAPLPDGEAANNAVRAAREMLDAVATLQAQGHIPPTRIGIGLHVGDAVTGIVGSALRKEYTIIGDVVNLASRIEGLNKQFGSQLLVSSAVREQALPLLQDAASRGTVPIKGREVGVEIFQAA